MLHYGVKVVARRRCLAAVRLQARVLSAEVHAPSKQPPTQKQPLVVRQYAVERNGEIRTTTYEAVPGSPGGFNKVEDIKKRRRRSWEVRCMSPTVCCQHDRVLSYAKSCGRAN